MTEKERKKFRMELDYDVADALSKQRGPGESWSTVVRRILINQKKGGK